MREASDRREIRQIENMREHEETREYDHDHTLSVRFTAMIKRRRAIKEPEYRSLQNRTKSLQKIYRLASYRNGCTVTNQMSFNFFSNFYIDLYIVEIEKVVVYEIV